MIMIACLKSQGCIFLTSSELWWLHVTILVCDSDFSAFFFYILLSSTGGEGFQGSRSVLSGFGFTLFLIRYNLKVEHLTAGTQQSKHVKTHRSISIAQELLTPWCCIAKANTGFLTLKSHKSPKILASQMHPTVPQCDSASHWKLFSLSLVKSFSSSWWRWLSAASYLGQFHVHLARGISWAHLWHTSVHKIDVINYAELREKVSARENISEPDFFHNFCFGLSCSPGRELVCPSMPHLLTPPHQHGQPPVPRQRKGTTKINAGREHHHELPTENGVCSSTSTENLTGTIWREETNMK